MTTYGAYDAGLPCKNTSCKSHGKPHPNCRCYGNMAAGGDVKNYCDSVQPHRTDCKYFKDGGDVSPMDVPQHIDLAASVSSYLAHHGLHGLVKMKGESPRQDIEKYNKSVEKGHKSFNARVESLFGGDGQPDPDHSKAKDFLDDWISKGGVTNDIQEEMSKQNEPPQNFAKGGAVAGKPEGILHKNHISIAYPEHNVMLQEAKGRASGYLTGLKPQPHQPKLAFDDAPDNSHQKKTYESALKVAAHPLGVLDEVRKGTLEPEHLDHLRGMYPELHDVMQKKLTQRITEDQLKDKKPSYHVRQGLSLLMGTPLSGELSPQNIQAAQSVFQSKKQQQQQAQPAKKTSAIAKSSQSYLLPSQAAAERQQKQ